MKTNKVSASPLLSALIVLLTVTLGAMAYVVITDDRSVTGNSGLMLAVGGIVLVAIIAMLLVRDARKRLAEQAEQNERNQAAILQLLDELADLLVEAELLVLEVDRVHRVSRHRHFERAARHDFHRQAGGNRAHALAKVGVGGGADLSVRGLHRLWESCV